MTNKSYRRIIREYITQDENNRLLGEGLIKTHEPEKMVRFLNQWFNKLITTEHLDTQDSYGILLVKPKKVLTKEKWELFISLINNYGYFVSIFVNTKGEKFNEFNEIKGDIHFLRLEPKFDIEFIPKDRYLYHITDRKNLGKILKIGLTPRTHSKVLNHPDRIYLSKDVDSSNNLRTNFIFNDLGEDLVTLKIDLQNLFIHLRQDVQYQGGVYTTDNIPPSHIELVN